MNKKRNTRLNRISIYEEFCVEMDLFSESINFPDWVFDYREHHLSKINQKLIKFCRIIKSKGIEFSILYPIQINGKWKFADIYIPSAKSVVMFTSGLKPIGSMSERTRFFLDRFKVYEIDGYESENNINQIITKLCNR